MSLSSIQTVLITGANRGIGKGIVAVYLSKSDVTVIAAVRDLESISTRALSSLPKAKNSSLITVKIDSSLEQDAIAAVRILESEHSINKVDVVIANAGTSASLGPVASITTAQVLNNVTPKFVVLGSQAGSIGAMEKAPAPMAAYGASKAMAHYFVRKIHFEHNDIISFAVEPGFAQSESGNSIAQMFGMKEAAVPISDSANFVVSQIVVATKDTLSGHFPAFPSGECLW
ncbi:Norsolorinic acid ketoreductase [Lachnellula cervina]|uniref:Norsolorinic acid ketoreductase n=1 Tax=Lachnellula cervina TaxID=1316786 RepID=A0A7D8ZC44_9HELO|nr:Norsolorinic acid ketoreductase [Lachnellula cervina]